MMTRRISEIRNHEVRVKERLALFIATLGQIAPQFTWYIDFRGAIRATHPKCEHHFCVLTAIYFTDTGKYMPTCEMHQAAEEISVQDIATRIVAAGDRMLVFPRERLEENLRKDLLGAVRLEEDKRFTHGR